MRKKIKISFLLLLSFIGLVFVSCELQEEAIHQHEHNSNLKLYEMKFEELMTNKKFVNSFSKLPKTKRSITNATFGRTVMENEYGFTIANKPAKVIETNGEISYTFLITRDSTNSDSFENLIIQTDSLNITKAVIIKYNLTSSITPTEDNSYTFTSNNEITPIVYNNTVINESSKEVITCYWVLTLCCNYGGTEHVAGPNCTPAYTYNTYKEQCYSWFDGPMDNNGGGGGGSTTSTGSNYDGSNTSIHGNGSNSLNTAPVVPEVDPNPKKDPCDMIKKLQADTNFKNRMALLIDKARNWSFESLSVLYNNTTPSTTNNYSYVTTDGSIAVPSVIYDCTTLAQGVIHSHYSGLVSIFSGGDLQDLYFKMSNQYITDDFFIAVVTSSNTAYLLQVPDRATFIAFGDKYLADKVKLNKFMEEIMSKKYNIKDNNSNSINELGFLKMMADLNMGVSLASVDFNASTPSAGTVFNTWTKKVYDKKTKTVIPSNCN